MARRVAITTIDNPHDPIEEFAAWFSFDISSGYHTLELLGRVVITSDELSDHDQEVAVELGIDEMVAENVTGVYRKIVQEV